MRHSLCLSLILFIGIVLSLLPGCQTPAPIAERPQHPGQEIIYHLFLRSFYDSDGDQHGDLNGLRLKLDYLQELGVTSVLLTPLYDSQFYHNYFPIDFETIDPQYGTKDDYFDLLKEMHRRGMKLYMDMEIHYVTADHLWFKDSFENPSSPYSDYVLYNGPGNTEPESIIYDLTELHSYDGQVVGCYTVNLYDEKVRDYFSDLFSYWVDPNQDGRFDDGIDGFRIDHIMDDLDWKGKFTGLLANFWKPLFQELRQINPDILIIGEQAEWGYGESYFRKGDVDAVFAFPLNQAMRSFDARSIATRLDSTLMITPPDKFQIIFVENHDMPRIASLLENDLPRLKTAAALNLLLKGIPSIYYGQEIGMQGVNGFGKFGITDGNDIPVREAFEWYETISGPGMALWYKGTGPWWDQSNLRDQDGISLQEQRQDAQSLWNFYRQMIAIRKMHPALNSSNQLILDNDGENVFTIRRAHEEQKILIALNMSSQEQRVQCRLPAEDETAPRQLNELFRLYPQGQAGLSGNDIVLTLHPFDIQLWQID